MPKQFSPGLLDDIRPEKEKVRDWKASELFSFIPFTWKEKPESDWRKFPIFNQNGSSSCVANAIAKTLGIENYIEEGKFVRFSARDIYSRRSNKPGLGMYYLEGMKLGNQGVTFEQLMPSDNLAESVMHDASDRTPLDEIVSKPAKGGAYLQLNQPYNIDEIASLIENSKKGVLLGVRFNDGEWFGKKVPIILGTTTKYGHAIVATDATLYNGKKAFVIDDSAYYDANKEAVRILTEDWFKAGRISFAGYYQFLSNQGIGVGEKPQHQFNVNLRQGTISEEVVWLKKCLNYEKCFPDGTFTQIFEGMTLKAVQLFQEKYKTEISGFAGYQISRTGNVLTGTRKQLNKLFA